jgi:succinate dehydrogenase/fumarate reductase flavoprotein subunit
VSSGEVLEADVLVVGAGMAGLSAAVVASQQGARVVVVERGAHAGGAAALSPGLFWAPTSVEVMHRVNPDGNPDLGRRLAEEFPDAVEWLRSLGVVRTPLRTPALMPFGVAVTIDVAAFVDRCLELLDESDAVVLFESDVESLDVADGVVVGARVLGRDGPAMVRASVTILATGGFQGDPELRRRYLGDEAVDVLMRANPGSNGAGLRLGLSVGATTSADMDRFYGHPVAHPIAGRYTPEDFLRLSQTYVELAVLIDPHGNRLVDESEGYVACTAALIRLPSQRAVVVGDAATRAAMPMDFVAAARARGGRTVEATSLGELAELVSAWGYDARQMEATLRDFNVWVLAEPAGLDPPRRQHRDAIEAPPLFAVEVQPAISSAFGGLSIDADCHVLDRHGQPIPGLLAAGSDVGGVHGTRIVGALADAAVFGRRAGLAVQSRRTTA